MITKETGEIGEQTKLTHLKDDRFGLQGKHALSHVAQVNLVQVTPVGPEISGVRLLGQALGLQAVLHTNVPVLQL